jgi:outer membrane receptor for ferrienterochelin and colicin
MILLLDSVFAAGEKIGGYVYDEGDNPVVGANVHWRETDRGTSTNADGFFEIERKDSETQLVVSYIGYTTVTVAVEENAVTPLRIVLKGEIELDEVVVSERRAGTVSSRTDVLQTQKITFEELCRAACCNLAESFETNPSVDVSYADASTGARQIRLLGLSGTYVQMLTENYPNFRGAASLYGLDYVPGPWMESIQISKGTSSVKNGYEAIAGQINVEYKKPLTADMFSANLFASDAGRYEANSDASWHVNDNLSTGLFVHYSSDRMNRDDNGDGFLDIPLKEQANVMNRWQHHSNSYVAQYGVRYIHENRTGGQTSVADPYRILIRTDRLEGYTKQAYVINPDRVESVALIMSGSYHDQQSDYGATPYNVYQNNVYASLMYESEFAPMHGISAGLSLNSDGFDENLTRQGERFVYDRREVVPGAYLQYTFNYRDRFILLAGIREDRSSLHGFFTTPRVHVKYNPFDRFHVRASVGKGFRTANVLTENSFLLSSSRRIAIDGDLKQEEAVNAGLNLAFYIPLGGKDLTVNAEWYYTNFIRQVVVDMDYDAHEACFYNLDGESFSSSFQIEATYQFPFLRGFTATAAYRYTDTQTDYRDPGAPVADSRGYANMSAAYREPVRRLKKPLANGYRGMLTASYQSPLKKWQFDVTGQFNGGGRMPLPDAYNPLWDERFSSFQVWNAQATKFFRTWSVYAGAENVFDFTQPNPVIDATNPRGYNFDGSMIWGPVHGRKLYIGFRYSIDRL